MKLVRDKIFELKQIQSRGLAADIPGIPRDVPQNAHIAVVVMPMDDLEKLVKGKNYKVGKMEDFWLLYVCDKFREGLDSIGLTWLYK
ncbi:hypothetical protein H9L39_19288 [Fusarium oxysporum f. sp. albedinis]|nr:hypothetical protein H9L39_19288 [Fusarium oxysporum f. sp. albedinis]